MADFGDGQTVTIILRPDQAILKQGVYDEWANGHSNVLAIAPTGSGKTVLSTDIILDGHTQGMTEIVMAHRNELVGQMSLAVAKRGIKHRIIGSSSTIAGIVQEHRAEFGRSFVNPDAKCAVASVQTVVSRADQLKSWAAQVDRWTLDEAHHAIGNETIEPNLWGRAIRMFTNARGLGVTACPKRADGKGLGKHHDGPFDAMVVGPNMRQLIDLRALSDYEIAVPTSSNPLEMNDDDLTASGDFSPKKMRQASDRSQIVGDVINEYSKRAFGRRAICFAIDVKDASDIAARFNEVGIPAMSVSAKTDVGVRRDAIRRFKAGQLWVLVNVDLFDEGFDVPACDVVIMARPTASLNKYLQMCLDTETEILTQRGWIGHSEMSEADIVAGFNVETDGIEWVPVKNVTRRQLSHELMYGIKSPHLDIRVTAGHDMVVKSRGPTAIHWQKQTAEEMAKRDTLYRIPVSGVIDLPDASISDDEIRFVGWFLSDGTFNRTGTQVSISQSASRPHYCDEIRRVFDACGFVRREYVSQRTGKYAHCAPNIQFCVSRGLREFHRENKGGRGWNDIAEWLDKNVGPIFDTLSARQFSILLEALNMGDGRRGATHTTSITCGNNRVMADRLQAIAVVRGWRCNVHVQKGQYGGKDQYIIAAKQQKHATIAGRNTRDGNVGGKKPYKRSRFETVPSDPTETVWCVENRLGTIITRRRGKVAIVGNCGRAMRRDPANPSKVALIIDHVSNFKRHLMPDRPRAWTLDRQDKRAKRAPDPDEIPLTACRECSRPYERALPRCPYCGAEPPLPAPGSRTPERVDGDLMLLDRATLERLRAAMTLESPGDVAERVGRAAGEIAGKGAANRQMERHEAQAALRGAIEQWAGIRRHMGEEDRAAHKRFYLTTGMTVLEALALPRAEMESLATMVRSWYSKP